MDNMKTNTIEPSTVRDLTALNNDLITSLYSKLITIHGQFDGNEKPMIAEQHPSGFITALSGHAEILRECNSLASQILDILG